jgi:hypothetical protein
MCNQSEESSEANNEKKFKEGLKTIQDTCDHIRKSELDEHFDSTHPHGLVSADLNRIAPTMRALLKNQHFHLMFINNSAVKHYILSAMSMFIRKQKVISAKLELFAIVEQLLALEVKLESVEFRTKNAAPSYADFFTSLSCHIYDLINYNRENLKKVELNKLKSFLRVLSYLLYCLPFDQHLCQILPSFLDFIFKDMNIVSFRLMLAIAVNVVFGEKSPTSDSNELFGNKLDLLRESHENALSFFKYSIENSESLKSEFTRQTFGLFIKRLEVLNKAFVREVEASGEFKSSENARRFLHLLVKNQKELSDLIQRKCSRLRKSTVNHFCVMHFEFSDSLLRVEGIRALLETEYANSGTLLAYELANVTIVYAQADEADLDVDLRIQLISILPTTICILNKYDWNNEMQLPGSNEFWSLIITRWTSIGFRMVSMFCSKSKELNIFCHSFFGFICMLLSGALSDKLRKRSYSSLLDLMSEEFLNAVLDLSRCYDSNLVENELSEEKFEVDMNPLLVLIFRCLGYVPFTTVGVYFRLCDFFVKLFRFESRRIKSLLRPNFELIIDKLCEFYANVDLGDLSWSVRESVLSRTVELAHIFIGYFFELFTEEESMIKESYMMIVRDDVLKNFLNDSSLVEFKHLKHIESVVDFYF